MCRNGEEFWPGATVDGRTNYTLLVRHFVLEKFGLEVDVDRASELVHDLRARAVPESEPETHRVLADILRLPVRPSGGCSCGA